MSHLGREYTGLHKVISGGQTGSDQGGLIAAKLRNVATGGTAPAKFMTTVGPQPQLAELYGMVAEGTLQSRTKKNIKDSDATLLISGDWASRGTILTMNLCDALDKPCIQFDTSATRLGAINAANDPSDEVLNFIVDSLIQQHVRVLNVAGNRERFEDNRTTMQAERIVGRILQLFEERGLLIHPL